MKGRKDWNDWQERWSAQRSRVARLGVLRELAAEIHAMKSRSPGSARPARASPKSGDLRAREAPLARLVAGAAAGGDLAALDDHELATALAAGAASVTSPTPIPPAIAEAFDGDRLTRPDRAWELAIAREAHRAGWEFWEISGVVAARAAEGRHHELIAALTPAQGVVLLTESSDTPPPRAGFWSGRWTICIPSPGASLVTQVLERWNQHRDNAGPDQPTTAKRRI